MNNLFDMIVYVSQGSCCDLHGIDMRNQLKIEIDSKLQADNNGEWLGSGWFEHTGDISFHNISDPDKAEKRVIEAFDELDLAEFFLRMEVFKIEDTDDIAPELN